MINESPDCEITFRERERQRDNLIFCKEDRNLCEVNERRIWNKNIDLLTLQALHSRLLAGIIQSWGFSVCFILVLSQSFHSHYTERALIFCLWSSKWKLMKKFSLILHFWGIYDIFFHLLSNLSLLKEKKGQDFPV